MGDSDELRRSVRTYAPRAEPIPPVERAAGPLPVAARLAIR